MRHEHTQILALLSEDRISVSEAERLLALTGVSMPGLLGWLSASILAATLILQNLAPLNAGLDFLVLRAAEMARLQPVHIVLPSPQGALP